MKYWITILCVMLSLSAIANAHLTGEEQEIGEYRIDFGYDPQNLTAGERSIISVNILNLSALTAINPESVFVRISNHSMIEFSGIIHPVDSGNIALSYTFVTGGEYEIDLRFHLQNNETIDSAFKVNVSEKISEIKEKPRVYSNIIDILLNPEFAFAIILVILVQIIIGYFYLKK